MTKNVLNFFVFVHKKTLQEEKGILLKDIPTTTMSETTKAVLCTGGFTSRSERRGTARVPGGTHMK